MNRNLLSRIIHKGIRIYCLSRREADKRIIKVMFKRQPTNENLPIPVDSLFCFSLVHLFRRILDALTGSCNKLTTSNKMKQWSSLSVFTSWCYRSTIENVVRWWLCCFIFPIKFRHPLSHLRFLEPRIKCRVLKFNIVEMTRNRSLNSYTTFAFNFLKYNSIYTIYRILCISDWNNSKTWITIHKLYCYGYVKEKQWTDSHPCKSIAETTNCFPYQIKTCKKQIKRKIIGKKGDTDEDK